MDQASMEALYRTYGSMVLRRARTLLGDEHAAQDMVQEVFMKAIRAFPTFRGESSLTTWLYQVTTNHCLNTIRVRARRRLRALQRPARRAATRERRRRCAPRRAPPARRQRRAASTARLAVDDAAALRGGGAPAPVPAAPVSPERARKGHEHARARRRRAPHRRTDRSAPPRRARSPRRR